MSKAENRKLPKKLMPGGAKRITNNEGKRVWTWKGMEFDTLRQLITGYNIPKNKEEKGE